MKKEDAEKLICPQMSGPVYERNKGLRLVQVNCETTKCLLWDDWGKEDERSKNEGDCGLRTLYELSVRCDGGI